MHYFKNEICILEIFAKFANASTIQIYAVKLVGIGRTGTIVGLDMAEHLFNAGESVNMREIVQNLRLQRHGSVQTDIQYVYIHRCIIALAENKKVIIIIDFFIITTLKYQLTEFIATIILNRSYIA